MRYIPQPVGDLKWAQARYQSVRGLVSSEWEIADGKFNLKVTIPVSATATVFVPAANVNQVTESGRPSDKSDGVKFLRMENGCAVFEIGFGNYEFAAVK